MASSSAPFPSVAKRESPDSEATFRKEADTYRLRREVEAIDYVRKHTSIPVPKILDIYLDADERGGSWAIMNLIPGQQLGEAWRTMRVSAKAQTISDLKSYLEQLRRLRPSEPGWIGSCSGGPAYDHRINNRATCGPFASISEFHDFLVASIKNCPRPEWVAKYRSQLPDDHPIVFAHADISWENILVDPATGIVTGIVDWEMAGFWPQWWEYRKALFGSRSQLWWMSVLEQIMPQYKSETDADMDIEMF